MSVVIYIVNQNVPAGTLEKTPIEVKLQVAPGVIHRVEITFPDGCNNEVSCAIYRFEHQMFPSNGSVSFIGNDEKISFREFEELKVNPSILKVVFYAPNTSYDHKIVVRIGILDKKYIEIVPRWIDVLEHIASVFRKPEVRGVS